MKRISWNLVLSAAVISVCSASVYARGEGAMGAADAGALRAGAAAITSKAQATNLTSDNSIMQANQGVPNTAAGKSAISPCPIPTLLDGWYVGAMLGYGAFKVQNDVNNPLFSGISGNLVNAASNWSAGALLGYGRSVYRQFYLGGEIFIVANNFEQAFNISTPINIYNNRTLNGPTYGIGILPGIKITPETLTYIRLGWNRATIKTQEVVTGAPSNNVSKDQAGFVYGIGMETLIFTNYSVRGEFDHMNFASYNTTSGYNTTVKTSNNEFFLTFIYRAG